jgi:3-oxoacyl-[acyl-carrier-protein] synthase-3
MELAPVPAPSLQWSAGGAAPRPEPPPLILKGVTPALQPTPPPSATGILGLGTCLPDTVLSNKDFERMVDTTDEWILSRTGIRERRILAPGQRPSDIAIPAARRAIEDAGLAPADIDGVIACTFTPDHVMPSMACMIQGALGISSGLCFDLNAACTGFVYGIQVATALLQSGAARRIVVVGCDANSRIIDYRDRSTCILFGDGAGAVVLGPVEAGRGVLGCSAGADGTGGCHLVVPIGGAAEPITAATVDSPNRYMQMNGREVFKFAVRAFNESFETAVARAGLKPADVDLLVPHQANVRIINSAMERYGFTPERVVVNIESYGNTSAASIPLALETARGEGRLRRGTVCALVAFGGGLTYGGAVVRW